MSNVNFNNEELARYSRHLIIPEFNIEGQRKLKASKVLVVGSGGLGSPLLLYLAAAGIGTIGIVDFDVIESSNLQRQVLFGTSDIGKSKALTAQKKLQDLNPHINIKVHDCYLNSENALDIIKDYDIVADGTDNFPTRYLVNDACVLLDKVNVYASIYRFEGQLSVFNYLKEDGSRGPNYRDLFPSPPPPGLVPSCAEGGVIGVLPGIMGSLQANEVIKVAAEIGDPLVGRLFLMDALSFETRTLKVNINPENPLTGENPTQRELIDYQSFCGINTEEAPDLKEVDVSELEALISSNEEFQLIDVREPHEFEIVNIRGDLFPLKSISQHANKIRKDRKVIIHCKSGARSTKAIKQLEEEFGFDNLYNLKGGILAYANEIDTSLPQY